MSVRDVNHTLTYHVDATTPVVGGAKGGVELYIRMDSKAEKKYYTILQLRQTSRVVAYFNILQSER